MFVESRLALCPGVEGCSMLWRRCGAGVKGHVFVGNRADVVKAV